VPTCADVLPLIPAPSAKKGKHGAKALRKVGMARAPCSASARDHERVSTKAVADQVLTDVEMGPLMNSHM
jgi:hypothetical protein